MRRSNVRNMTNPTLVTYARNQFRAYAKAKILGEANYMAFHLATLTTALVELDRRHIIVDALPKLQELLDEQ